MLTAQKSVSVLNALNYTKLTVIYSNILCTVTTKDNQFKEISLKLVL